jgi:hypothetical protein
MNEGLWEFHVVNAVKVDEAHRIQLSVLKPGDLYQPEIHGPEAEEITLRRLNPSLGSEFEKLAQQWKKETFFHSSLSIKYTHPAYQRIIGMGRPVLPFILRDLGKSPERWFYALKFIAGEDPAGKLEGFEAAREAWLRWGREHHYI